MPCPHGLPNPLFSFILAGGVSEGEDSQVLLRDFFEISSRLKRLEVIHVLCVLSDGVMSWAFRDPLRQGEIRPALFMMDDLFHPIFPIFSSAATHSPLLCLVQAMQLSLYHTISDRRMSRQHMGMITGYTCRSVRQLRFRQMRSGWHCWHSRARRTESQRIRSKRPSLMPSRRLAKSQMGILPLPRHSSQKQIWHVWRHAAPPICRWPRYVSNTRGSRASSSAGPSATTSPISNT
jgi:hypothetical protein